VGLRELCGPQRAMWASEGYVGLRGLYGPQLRSALFGAKHLSLREPNHPSRSEDVRKGR